MLIKKMVPRPRIRKYMISFSLRVIFFIENFLLLAGYSGITGSLSLNNMCNMAKIGIFYGSTTGNTEKVASMIRTAFGEENAAMYNVDTTDLSDITKFKYLIFGVSTWGVSDLQDDFEDFLEVLKQVDFSGKKVALFGLGDQSTYSDSFVDAMGILYDWLKKKGATIVGSVPRTGYNFSASMALVKGNLVGLAIDEEFESHLTAGRVSSWVESLKKDFSL
jgi:flavodoxin I